MLNQQSAELQKELAALKAERKPEKKATKVAALQKVAKFEAAKIDNYFKLIDSWVSKLNAVFEHAN